MKLNLPKNQQSILKSLIVIITLLLSFLGGTQYQKVFNPSSPSLPFYPSTATVTKITNLLQNQTITLEYEQGYEEDVYDRLVAYVFLNDTNINIELIKNGLAEVTIYEKRRAWKYQDELLTAQEEAQTENLGIWSED